MIIKTPTFLVGHVSFWTEALWDPTCKMASQFTYLGNPFWLIVYPHRPYNRCFSPVIIHQLCPLFLSFWLNVVALFVASAMDGPPVVRYWRLKFFVPPAVPQNILFFLLEETDPSASVIVLAAVHPKVAKGSIGWTMNDMDLAHEDEYGLLILIDNMDLTINHMDLTINHLSKAIAHHYQNHHKCVV